MQFLKFSTKLFVAVTNWFRNNLKNCINADRIEFEVYKQLMDFSPVGFVITTVGGAGLEVNKYLLKMLGYNDSNEFFNTQIQKAYLNKDDRDIFIKQLMKGNVQDYETQLLKKDGTPLWVSINAGYIKQKSKERVIFSIIQDISKRKKYEEDLINEKNNLESVINSLPGIFYQLDINGDVVNCNRKLAQVLGYEKDEILFRSSLKFISESDREHIKEALKRIFREGNYQVEAFIKTKYGQEIPYLLNGQREIIDGEDNCIGMGIDISALKEIESSLREKQLLINKVNEQSPQLVYILDLTQNRFTYFSKDISSVLGYNNKKIIPDKKMFMLEFVHPDDYDTIENVRKSFFNNEIQESEFELRLKAADGKYKWFLCFEKVFQKDNGKTATVLGTAIEITDRKIALDDLNNSRRQLQTLMDLSPLPILWHDDFGNITYCNNKFSEIFGRSRREILSLSEFFNSSFPNLIYKNRIIQTWTNSFIYARKSGGTSVHFEIEAMCNKSELRYFEVSGAVLPNCTFIIFSDLTKIKYTTRKLAESEEKFSQAFYASPVPMVILKLKDDKIIEVNDAFVRGTGYERLELIGRTDIELKLWKNPNDRKNAMQILLKEGKVDNLELQFNSKSGKILTCKYYVVLIRLGGEQCVLGNIVDITEHKIYELALKESEDKFSKAFFSNPIPMAITRTVDGNFLEINKAFELITGYKREEIINASDIQLGFWMNIVQRREIEKQLIKYGEVHKKECDFLTKNKSHKICLYSASFIEIKEQKCVLAMILDITEQKQEEKNRIEVEGRFKKLVEMMNDMVFITKMNHVMIWANPSLERITGFNAEDFQKPTNLHPDDEKKAIKFLTEFVANSERTTASMDSRVFDKWGKLHWFNNNLTKINYCGEPAILYIVRDITEDRIAQNSLEESEQRLKNLSEAAIEGIAFTENGIITEVNTRLTKIFDLSGDEIIGKSISDFLNFHKKIKSKNQKKDIHEFYEDLIVTKKLKKKPVEIRTKVLEIEGRELNVTIVHDISYRKNIEIAKRKTEERYRLLVENLHDLVIELTEELNYQYVNPSFTSTLGYSANELIGKNIVQHIHPEDCPKILESLTNNNLTQEHRVKHQDGTWRWLNSSGKRFDTIHGLKRIVVISRDITDKKNAELELDNYRMHLEKLIKERTKELDILNKRLQREVIKQKKAEKKVKESLIKEKELSELKSKFISITSHEFRTPLTTIYSSTELLEKYSDGLDERMKILQIERIKKSVEFLTNLLEDVLTISRADTGKIKFSPAFIDVEKTSKILVEETKLSLSTKHRIQYSYKAERKKYFLDQKLFRFMISNLLSNAVKYSPNGGEVNFCIETIQKDIIITITDEGIGIPDKNKSNLFEPFNRGINVGNIRGTGLGMSIVKRGVDLHGGNITFESELNKGTKFLIKIPIHYPDNKNQIEESHD